jgi:dephospho-CoA kinase
MPAPLPPPLHVALTGNIASGKSTVARLLAAHGAVVIDADQLAREAVAPGTPGLTAVVDTFGPGVLAADGTLDRAALRQRVFRDPAARQALNAIVHPAVARLREARVAEATAVGARILVSEIPLLFEVGLEHAFAGVILVDAPEAVRLDRLVRDRGLAAAEAQAMIDAQWPADRKRAGATWVIDNDGPPAQLPERVAALWSALLAHAAVSAPPPGVSSVSNIPGHLQFTKDHEYVTAADGDGVVTIGITDFAQGELGDIVFVDLPRPGASFGAHDVFGTVEAVKAVSELYMPVAGEVVAINGRLDGEPALINSDPYGDGWMIKVRPTGGDDGLMDAAAYRALLGG